MRSSSARGQASIEYVGALALLVLVFSVSVAVAAPDLPRTVAGKLRLALCIVGMDICRAADAQAAGLEPCVVAGEDWDKRNGLSFLVIRVGGSDFWSIQRLSDGTVLVSEGYGQSIGASGGPGVSFGGASVGASAGGSVDFRSGRTWAVSEERLRKVLAMTGGDLTKYRLILPALLGDPAESFLEGGGAGAAELAAAALRSVPGAGADARVALGRRKSAKGTTYYLDLGADSSGPITDVLDGTDLHGRVVAEYRTGSPPVITLRTSGRGGDDEEVQTVLRLALRTPADVAAARRVAFLSLDDPTFAMRDLVARIHERGTVERLRYRTRSDDGGWAYELGFGLQLGADHATSSLTRELVDAQVLNGPVPATREDCLLFANP